MVFRNLKRRIKLNRRYSSKRNGRKGGRPISDQQLQVNLPDFDLVILTSVQYASLVEKYGYTLLKKALCIFQDWLQTSHEGEKYRGKNNYAHFRSDGWVINTAKHV